MSGKNIRDPAWNCKIKAGNLMNRLHKNSMGELKPPMTDSEIRSATSWLKKVVPDLASMSVDANVRGQITLSWPVGQSELDA